MKIKEALNLATKKIRQASLSPHLDAEVLLSFVLHKDKAWLYANFDRKLSQIQYSKFQILIKKRVKRWPVAYLIGHKEFFSLDFVVTPDVLIPRPETELLVELALEQIKNKECRIENVVEVGTGSGNIIISIAAKLTEYHRLVYDTPKLYGTDTSKKALVIARENAKFNGVSKKIKFLRGNLLDPLFPLPLMRGRASAGHRNLIIANLPYLTRKQHKNNPDLKCEPKNALVGGDDGLRHFRELFQQLKIFCRPRPDRGSSPRSLSRASLDSRFGGNDKKITLLLEHDPSQKVKLETLAKKYLDNFQIEFHKDLTGKYRVCEIITIC